MGVYEFLGTKVHPFFSPNIGWVVVDQVLFRFSLRGSVPGNWSIYGLPERVKISKIGKTLDRERFLRVRRNKSVRGTLVHYP